LLANYECEKGDGGGGKIDLKIYFFLGVIDKLRYFPYKNLYNKRLLAGKWEVWRMNTVTNTIF